MQHEKRLLVPAHGWHVVIIGGVISDDIDKSCSALALIVHGHRQRANGRVGRTRRTVPVRARRPVVSGDFLIALRLLYVKCVAENRCTTSPTCHQE